MTDTDPLLVARRYFGSSDPITGATNNCKVGFSISCPTGGAGRATYRINSKAFVSLFPLRVQPPFCPLYAQRGSTPWRQSGPRSQKHDECLTHNPLMHSSRITAGATQLFELREDHRLSGRNSKMGLCPGWQQHSQ